MDFVIFFESLIEFLSFIHKNEKLKVPTKLSKVNLRRSEKMLEPLHQIFEISVSIENNV